MSATADYRPGWRWYGRKPAGRRSNRRKVRALGADFFTARGAGGSMAGLSSPMIRAGFGAASRCHYRRRNRMKHAELAQARLRFEGLKVLVVEDESIVSFLLEDMLTDIGCEVLGPAAALSEAFTLFDKLQPQAAVLDVNLHGEMVYPFAERLERDRVPFLFATGYGAAGIPERWQRWPVIQKPFQLKTLAGALERAVFGEPSAIKPSPSQSPTAD